MLRPSLLAFCLAPLAAQGWVDRTSSNPVAGPSPRWDGAMCWDATHGYVLLAGGSFATDTWSWDGTAWTRRLTATALPQIQRQKAFAMTFHPPTGEVVLVAQNQTYTWNGADWLAHPYPALAGLNNSYNTAMGHDPGR